MLTESVKIVIVLIIALLIMGFFPKPPKGGVS